MPADNSGKSGKLDLSHYFGTAYKRRFMVSHESTDELMDVSNWGLKFTINIEAKDTDIIELAIVHVSLGIFNVEGTKELMLPVFEGGAHEYDIIKGATDEPFLHGKFESVYKRGEPAVAAP